MNLLQPQSRKITKKSKKKSDSLRTYQCSQCKNTYGSYATLYLHKKQKHNGASQNEEHSQKIGRPKKPKASIDEMGYFDASVEDAHDDLMWLLLEKLSAVKEMAPKDQLEIIQGKIKETYESFTDEWMTDLFEEAIAFLNEYNAREPAKQDLDFEEEFMHMDSSKSLRVLIWLIMWLGKLYVKTEFIPDICLIFSRIWKTLDETKLGVEDLDNKLVWKKAITECEELEQNLSVFRGNLALLHEFIQKVCRLVGKVFEDK